MQLWFFFTCKKKFVHTLQQQQQQIRWRPTLCSGKSTGVSMSR